MSTREEIEAAAKRRQKWNDDGHPNNSYDVGERPYDADTLAEAYLTDNQQRERDQQPPTREMFERLKTMHLFCGANISGEHSEDWTTWGGHAFCQIDTIAKLRAACLLLGIDTEGVL